MAEKIYSIYYTKNGEPVEGISPSVILYKSLVDNSNIPFPSITEVSDGFYKFTADPTISSIIKIDSNDITMNISERYKILKIDVTDTYIDDSISSLRADIATLSSTFNAIDSNIDSIETQINDLTTKNIPGAI